ncbi:MAG: protoporphyrinogen oxidase [Proteobacteria bacterium]|nr:protoporphyrinogen oxidase [Pseudomonadota bacterium]
MRIGVVGAGISGLATAFWLQRHRPDWHLTVWESAPNAGGTLHTEIVDGFHFEAGCNGFLTNKPATLELVHASGAEHLLLESSASARKRFLYNGGLHRLPESPPAFLASKLLSPLAKLRVAAEILIPARRDGVDETLQAFGYRRLGRAFTDTFLNAMTAGIYGSTPEKLSVAAAFPLVAALEREHGGLFRGMLAKRRGDAGPGGVLTSFHSGVSTFIEHLQRSVRADWRLATPVSAIERAGAGFLVCDANGRTELDQIVVCTPAHAATRLLAPLDASLSALLGRIEYSPIAVVGLGYHALSHPLDGVGVLSTSGSKLPVLGILWDSSVFPDRAPAGAKILRVMIGGQREPASVQLDDKALVELARAGIRQAMGVDATPDVRFVKRWERGIPNYGPGHLERVAAIDAAVAALPGLHLNNNAYHGVAMNDCCAQSAQLAQRITAAYS